MWGIHSNYDQALELNNRKPLRAAFADVENGSESL